MSEPELLPVVIDEVKTPSEETHTPDTTHLSSTTTTTTATSSATSAGAAGATTSGNIVEARNNMEINEVAHKIAEVRQHFRSNKTLSKRFRAEQLRKFRAMLVDNISEWHEALHKDLNKSEWESYTTETVLILREIQYMLDNMSRLTRSESKCTNLLNVPGWSYVHKDPLGVVLIMGAWNFPLQLTLLPLVGAIAAGNCAIIKPPSFSVHTSNLINKLLPQYLDSKSYLVIEGGINISTEVLKQRFDLIFYTGSSVVGKIIMQAACKYLTPCILELGGKSPVVVDGESDVELAARRICWGSFLNAGQICIRPDYVLVHPSKAKKLVELLRARLDVMFGVNPLESTEFCRIVNVQNTQRLEALIEDARPVCHVVAQSGEVNCSARFIPPTLLDFGNNEERFLNSKVMQGEIFGPILPIFSPSDPSSFLDYCIHFINNRDKPLALYVFTTSSKTRERITEETSSGGLVFNDVLLHITNDSLPFGGIGLSGMGAYHGDRSFEAFSHSKAVLRKTSFLDLAFRYPPYTKWGKFQAGLLMAPRPHWQLRVVMWIGILLLLGVIALAIIGGNPTIRRETGF